MESMEGGYIALQKKKKFILDLRGSKLPVKLDSEALYVLRNSTKQLEWTCHLTYKNLRKVLEANAQHRTLSSSHCTTVALAGGAGFCLSTAPAVSCGALPGIRIYRKQHSPWKLLPLTPRREWI